MLDTQLVAPDLKLGTLNDLLNQAFEQPEATAAVMFRRKLSYAELNQLSRNFAAYLQNLGLTPGERVAVMLPNLLHYPVVVAALIRAGLVVVNLNPMFKTPEIKKHLLDASPSALIVFDSSFDRLQGALNPELHTVIRCGLGDLSTLAVRVGLEVGANVAAAMSRSRPTLSEVRVVNFAQGSRYAGELKAVSVEPDDLALLQYTGGTSGELKAAMITHANLMANLEQCEGFLTTAFQEDTQGIPDVILTALPLYHIFSFFVSMIMAWHHSRCALLVPNPRDIDSLVNLLRTERVTIFTGINTLYKALLRHPKFGRIDFSGYKLTLSGAMALEPQVADEWHRLTGLPILQGYGLTEASPVVTASPLDIPKYNGTVGVPLPRTQVKIVDANDKELAIGGVGEILIKGPQVIKGYWQRQTNPNACPYFTKEGYFRTGDIGSFDSRGYLRIIDRKKDMMIISGFNVYPLEIESVLEQHPEVFQAGVVGCFDEVSGERPVAFIVPADSHIATVKLDEWVRKNLASYKCPVRYHLIDQMPLSTVGKLKRSELRKALSDS